MTDMRERVARAIAKAQLKGLDFNDPEEWKNWLPQADAAIAAAFCRVSFLNTMRPEGSRPLALTWGEHERNDKLHTEWYAPCGCAFHPEGHQGPHIHPCNKHGTVMAKPSGRYTWEQILKASARANEMYGQWMPQQWIDALNQALRELENGDNNRGEDNAN